MKRLTLMFALAAMTALVFGCGEDSETITRAAAPAEFETAGQSAGLPGGGAVFRLFGDAKGYEGTVPDIDGDGVDDPATCFDVDILNAAGRKIGTATDCLSNIEGVGGGLSLVGTTIFRLSNGTFISRGSTTVQPVTTADPTPVTHTTGAIPMEGSNGILSGTGAYRNMRAQVRLSGAVNLSRLEAEGRIAFDCLFAVQGLPSGTGAN